MVDVDILSLMLYTKFGCHHHLPGSLLISRIKLFMGQVRYVEVRGGV